FGRRRFAEAPELRVPPVAARPAGEHGLREQALAPERNQALAVEVTPMQGPEAHEWSSVGVERTGGRCRGAPAREPGRAGSRGAGTVPECVGGGWPVSGAEAVAVWAPPKPHVSGKYSGMASRCAPMARSSGSVGAPIGFPAWHRQQREF